MSATVTLDYCYNEDGAVYFARGDIADSDFLAALNEEVTPDDAILLQSVEHGYMRYSPDPHQVHPVLLAFGVAQRRGAWRATWISLEGTALK